MQKVLRAVALVIGMGLMTSCESGGGGFSLGDVRFLNADVSGWAETASLNVAGLSRSSVTLDYDKKNVWPGKQGVNASCWVVFQRDGIWYASTFDYMRPGQTTKGVDDLYIDGPDFRWRPSGGEEVGFMVSGLARDSRRNVEERSNVVFVNWP